MTDYHDDADDQDDRLSARFLLMLMRAEVERLRDEVDLSREVDQLCDAIESGRAVAFGGWWGEPDDYIAELKDRLDAAMAFPSTPWWREEPGD